MFLSCFWHWKCWWGRRPISPFLPCFPLSPPPRATQARPEAAGEGAAAQQVGADPGTRTTRSPPSPRPTTPSPLLFTWWSTIPRATSATRCHTTGLSTRTRTRSCPRSWCPTCWRRRATSSPTRCPRWVDASCNASVTSAAEKNGVRPPKVGAHFQRKPPVIVYLLPCQLWRMVRGLVGKSISVISTSTARIGQAVKASDTNTALIIPPLPERSVATLLLMMRAKV